MRNCSVIAMTLSLAILSRPAVAELSPESYANFQAAAPEALTIHVQSVQLSHTIQPEVTTTEVVATAIVRGVDRTETALRVGQKITICYRIHKRRQVLAGPGEVPQLKSGETKPAFLEFDGAKRWYVPAAGAYSFDRLPSPQQSKDT